MPQPPKGYCSRGEVLEGIKPVGTNAGFWVAAAGGAWRWSATTRNWMVEPEPPPMSVDDSVLGALPIQGGIAYIVRHELLPFLLRPGQPFKSDTITLVNGSGPHELSVREGVSFLAEMWTVANASAYICDRDGRMLIVSPSEVTPIPTPGGCEAVAVDEQGNLVASFRGHGIFRFTGSEWRLLSSLMPGSGQGEYWAYVAINNDEIAYVTQAKPVVAEQTSHGRNMHWKRNAETAAGILWGKRACKEKLNRPIYGCTDFWPSFETLEIRGRHFRTKNYQRFDQKLVGTIDGIRRLIVLFGQVLLARIHRRSKRTFPVERSGTAFLRR